MRQLGTSMVAAVARRRRREPDDGGRRPSRPHRRGVHGVLLAAAGSLLTGLVIAALTPAPGRIGRRPRRAAEARRRGNSLGDQRP
ncbi:hypothetical protein HBB16_07385 [Pseudonocardia sp. MCCB 268]|nr:hypothetical protein [Pseudonocardia cytotoxica]